MTTILETTADVQALIDTSTAALTKSSVGLGNVDNTADASKPVSTAQQTALNLKANLAGPTFTGTVGGITATMVGLGSVNNTSDAGKPVSTAQQTALDLKANLAGPTFTGTVTFPSGQALVAPALGTPASGTLTNCTFPTLNQNTSGTASNLSGTPTLPSGTTLVAPVLGTPASGTMTNVSGTAASLTAGNATKLTTGRTIALTGDVTYTSGSFDGSGNVTGTATLANIPALAGTNLTGTAASLTAGNVTTVPMTNTKTLRLDGNFGIAYAIYSFGTDGGLVSTITPGGTKNTTIPANAILVGGVINVTTAVLSAGSATVAIGCAGTGGATTTLLAATAKASLTINSVFPTVTTFAVPKKLTGAGGITFTIGTAALTAGVIEVWVQYFTAAA